MERRQVQSKGVNWVRYDEDTKILEVEYASSLAYRYFDVQQDVYEWLMKVNSKGKFVARLVKDNYRYERLEPDCASADEGNITDLLKQSLRQPTGD